MTQTPHTVTEHPMPGVTRITLARPDSLNALSSDMMAELLARLEQVAADPECRVVVLAAQGKAFSAGHDLREMRTHPDLAFYQNLFAQCSRLMVALQQLPQPVIAAVNGAAAGGGFALVLGSDIRLSARSAKFNAAFIRIGLSACDIGTSWMSSNSTMARFSARLIAPSRMIRVGFPRQTSTR